MLMVGDTCSVVDFDQVSVLFLLRSGFVHL